MTDVKRWRGLKSLLTDAVEQGATAIERVHKKSSERPFEILKAVAPLEEPVREIQAGSGYWSQNGAVQLRARHWLRRTLDSHMPNRTGARQVHNAPRMAGSVPTHA